MSSIHTPLPPIGKLFSDSWSNYKNKFGVIFQIGLVVVIFNVIVSLFSSSVVGGQGFQGLDNPEVFTGVNSAGLIASVFILNMLSGLLGLVSTVAVILALIDQSEGGSFIDYYSKALKMLTSYLWVSILVGIAVVGGFIAFIIPGFMVAVWLSFAFYILLIEDVRGMKALARSREYVRGYWADLFGRHALLVFCYLSLAFIYGLVFGLAGFVLVEAFPELELVVLFVDGLIVFLASSFVVTYGLTMYYQIKAVKGDVIVDEKSNSFKGFLWAGIVFIVLGLVVAPILLISLNTARQKAQDSYIENQEATRQIELEMERLDQGQY